jgi:hypothetical protein
MKRRKLHRLIATVAALAITAGMLGATAPEREDGQAIGHEQEVQEARVAERGFVPAPDLCPEIAELIDIVMHLARNDGRDVEWQDIAASIICTRGDDLRTADSVDFRCVESVRQYFGLPPRVGMDEEHDLLFAFAVMFLAAERQVGRNVVDEPIFIYNYTNFDGEFVLGFLDEKYFVLVDFIAYFTGIDRDEFVLEVGEPVRVSEPFTYVISDEAEFDPDFFVPEVTEPARFSAPVEGVISDEVELENEVANSQPQVLPMGTFVNIHWRVNGIGRQVSATLGHPINTLGTRAITTNHLGLIPEGATVHLTNGTRIGTIDLVDSRPDIRGTDISRIVMENGFTVSRQAEFVNITNFWARLGTPTTTAQLRALVEPNYAITTNAATGVVMDIDGILFVDVIRINSNDFIDQDRGAVLVNANNNAVGNFIIRFGSFGYFSRTANYWL